MINISYSGYRFPPEIIQHAIWLYLRFTLSFRGSAAGAAAILALVLYFAFQADGCIVPKHEGQPACLSGIVEDTASESSTAIAVLAPFAMGPAGKGA